MFRKILSSSFARFFYPTKKGNWYKEKGYKGQSDSEIFEDFIQKQNFHGAIFYKDFNSLTITRQYIISGKENLDSVFLIPNKETAKDKPGFGLCIVMFQGRGEYYESRFRDMAKEAEHTGATIVGFNHKGFYSSGGATNSLSDLAEDGIAVVDFLLRYGISYDKIILQGNSLGASVQEIVSQHYKSICNRPLRQINSNSFSTLSAVFAYRCKVPFLKNLFGIVLRYVDWDINPKADFYKIGPYRFHLRRYGDKVILPEAEYHKMIDFDAACDDCPIEYKETLNFLYKNSQLTYMGKKKGDAHFMPLSEFYSKNNDDCIFVYDIINRYFRFLKKID